MLAVSSNISIRQDQIETVLDLLQTSALLVAATALIGTVTATGLSRLSALVVPSDPSDIQVSEIVQQKGRSLLRRLNGLGIWI